MSTVTPLPVIAGVQIHTDHCGRFNLNALHRASGAGDHKRPSKWLATEQARELAAALQAQSPKMGFEVIQRVRGGNAGGTFAHELLAVEYAGWISPAFRLKVNQTFLDYRRGTLQPLAVPQTLPEALRMAADLAEEAEAMRPKVAALDRIAGSKHGAMCVTDAAKALQVRRGDLIDWLLSHGWCYRRAGRRGHLVAYQAAIERGVLKHKVNTIDSDDGPRTVQQVLVTPKGLASLAQRIGTGKVAA